MKKDKIKGVITIVGFFILMMTAASVSADGDDEPGLIDRDDYIGTDVGDSGFIDTTSVDEPYLISPNTDDGDFENLILAPDDNLIKEEDSNIFTTDFAIVVGLSGFAGLALGLLIFGRKN